MGTWSMSGARQPGHAEGRAIGASTMGGGLTDLACANIWAEPANLTLLLAYTVFWADAAQPAAGAIVPAWPLCPRAHRLAHSTSRMLRHVPVGTSSMSGARHPGHAEGRASGASTMGGGLKDPACANIWAEPAHRTLLF